MSIAGYQLQIRDVTNGGSPSTVDVGNVLTHDFTGLTENTNYGIKVRSRDAGGNFSAWGTEEFQTTPAAASPLTDHTWFAYHDAERLSGLADGDDVLSFTDYSGNVAHLTKLSGQTAPTFVAAEATLNNKKAVKLDSSGDGLYANWGATGECTLFFVGNFTGNGGFFQPFFTNTAQDWRLRFQPGTTAQLTQSTVDTALFDMPHTQSHIVRVEMSSSDTKIFLDGVEVTDDSSPTTKPGDAFVGSYPSNVSGVESPFIYGFIGITDGLVTGSAATAVETYFKTRYAIP